MKKKCELCKVPARTFCESDQASLCWDCDAKVHAANFLVARHSRTLLCHECRSPTPWKASGATLGNTVSVCHRCTAQEETAESEGGNDDGIELAGHDDGDNLNQLVPRSSTPPPPPSSSEESVSSCSSDNGGDGDVSEPVTTASSLKRQREDNDASDRDFQEDRANGSVSQRRYGGGEWREEVACHGVNCRDLGYTEFLSRMIDEFVPQDISQLFGYRLPLI